MSDHVDRYVPAETNGGWGFAAGVMLLAIVLIATVTYIHKQTYRHPTDVTWHGKGSGDAAALSMRARLRTSQLLFAKFDYGGTSGSRHFVMMTPTHPFLYRSATSVDDAAQQLAHPGAVSARRRYRSARRDRRGDQPA